MATNVSECCSLWKTGSLSRMMLFHAVSETALTSDLEDEGTALLMGVPPIGLATLAKQV